MLVAEATRGNDPDLAIAAVFHDSIEDQEVPREVIAGAFGEDVASLVEEVTDDKSLGKRWSGKSVRLRKLLTNPIAQSR